VVLFIIHTGHIMTKPRSRSIPAARAPTKNAEPSAVQLLRYLIILAYLVLGILSISASWNPAGLLHFRETFVQNSTSAFGDYACVTNAGVAAPEMGYLAVGSSGEAGGSQFDFAVARYVMAPQLLRNGYHGEQWAIARYTDEGMLLEALERHDLVIDLACGRGVYLLRRRED